MIAAHERLQTDAVGDFLEWLLSPQNDYRICIWSQESGKYVPVQYNTKQWLAEYADIDMEIVNKERMHVLEWIRNVHAQDDLDRLRQEQKEAK